MKNVKDEAIIWVRLIGFIVIWVLLLEVNRVPLKINVEALKLIPDVVTLYVIAQFAFSRWMWRWPIFQGWLVPYPDLEGTWEGVLRSTWKDPLTGEDIPPRTVTLVVKQSFTSISCTLFTDESSSRSSAAQISEDETSEALTLNYNYTNRSRATIRDRSPIHDGACSLRIIKSPQLRLEGEYWTGRCTTGEIDVRFHSRELKETFQK